MSSPQGQAHDGGWWDEYGNYVYQDNTYYDPEGVYRNADGSVYVQSQDMDITPGYDPMYYLEQYAHLPLEKQMENLLVDAEVAYIFLFFLTFSFAAQSCYLFLCHTLTHILTLFMYQDYEYSHDFHQAIGMYILL